jgi:hypothetical protein
VLTRRRSLTWKVCRWCLWRSTDWSGTELASVRAKKRRMLLEQREAVVCSPAPWHPPGLCPLPSPTALPPHLTDTHMLPAGKDWGPDLPFPSQGLWNT